MLYDPFDDPGDLGFFDQEENYEETELDNDFYEENPSDYNMD